jgi:hypothetical protein
LELNIYWQRKKRDRWIKWFGCVRRKDRMRILKRALELKFIEKRSVRHSRWRYWKTSKKWAMRKQQIETEKPVWRNETWPIWIYSCGFTSWLTAFVDFMILETKVHISRLSTLWKIHAANYVPFKLPTIWIICTADHSFFPQLYSCLCELFTLFVEVAFFVVNPLCSLNYHLLWLIHSFLKDFHYCFFIPHDFLWTSIERCSALKSDLIIYVSRCKPNVVGRTCDRCVAGHHSFPYCQQCDCDLRGTTLDICDQVCDLC